MRCPPRCGLSSTPTTTTTTTTPRSSGSIRILNGITGRLVVAAVWVWVGLLRWMVGGSSSSSSSSSNIAPTAFSAGSGRRRMPHPVGGSSRPVPQRPFQQQSHPRRLGRRRPNSGGTAAFAIAAANRVVPFATTITQTTMSHRATVMDDDTTNDDTDFSDPVPPYYAHHPRKKAARTNKYQQFSKVQSSALDPQELLLRDATRQNSQLAAAERLSGWPKPNQAAAKANLAGFAAATDDTPPRPATVADFPDTKGIDVSTRTYMDKQTLPVEIAKSMECIHSSVWVLCVCVCVCDTRIFVCAACCFFLLTFIFMFVYIHIYIYNPACHTIVLLCFCYCCVALRPPNLWLHCVGDHCGRARSPRLAQSPILARDVESSLAHVLESHSQ